MVRPPSIGRGGRARCPRHLQSAPEPVWRGAFFSSSPKQRCLRAALLDAVCVVQGTAARFSADPTVVLGELN
jgi:hypothetical protein